MFLSSICFCNQFKRIMSRYVLAIKSQLLSSKDWFFTGYTGIWTQANDRYPLLQQFIVPSYIPLNTVYKLYEEGIILKNSFDTAYYYFCTTLITLCFIGYCWTFHCLQNKLNLVSSKLIWVYSGLVQKAWRSFWLALKVSSVLWKHSLFLIYTCSEKAPYFKPPVVHTVCYVQNILE